MKTYYVYALYGDGEELPFYIGKTYQGSIRLSTHLWEARQQKVSAKVNKINSLLSQGKGIRQDIVFISTDEQECFEKEKELILFYGRKDNGTGILCNHTRGGEGSAERLVSVDTRQKLRNRCVSEETRKRISESRKGKKLNSATRKKLSVFRTGNKYRQGKPNTPEHRQKMNEAALKANSVAISIVTLDGAMIGEYDSFADASRELGVSIPALSQTCSGKHKYCMVAGKKCSVIKINSQS